MTEARMQDAWSRTASVMALLANCYRDPKRSRAFRPDDFDPFAQAVSSTPVGIEILKDLFIDREP